MPRRQSSPYGANDTFLQPYISLSAATLRGREAKARSWFLNRSAAAAAVDTTSVRRRPSCRRRRPLLPPPLP